jgi:PAS domain S-box-containing protein
LVWVNPSFTRLTGYPLEEVAGRNCRFLQGPNTDRAAVARIADALRSQEPITEVLLNYRRDGTAFWNQLSISPVTDGAGEVVNFVGVQNDVTERAPALVPELPERGADRHPDDPTAGTAPRPAPGRRPGRALRAGRGQRPALRDRARRGGDAAAQPAAGRAGRRRAAGGCLLPGRRRRQPGRGDWYDVLPLPDGAIGLAVGDVVGHDLSAAAAMGQLRGVLRSYAWDGGRPGSVLDRCDQLVQGLEMAALATAVYARLEPPDPDGTRRLRYANAGHPTPLLLRPSSELVRLDGHRSPMIGVLPPDGRGRGEAEIRCPPGSLVLYTDGLTDVAGDDADERTALVERTVAGVGSGATAQTVVDTVLTACKPTRLGDDVALLAVRLDA